MSSLDRQCVWLAAAAARRAVLCGSCSRCPWRSGPPFLNVERGGLMHEQEQDTNSLSTPAELDRVPLLHYEGSRGFRRVRRDAPARVSQQTPSVGFCVSELEERFRPTEVFVVGNFAHQQQRMQSADMVADPALLAPLSFDQFFSSEQPAQAGSHPLQSLKKTTGKTRKRQRRAFLVRERAMSHSTRTADTSKLIHSDVGVGTILLRVAFFRGSIKLREVEVHSHQTLLELRGVLSCVTDAEIAHQMERANTEGCLTDGAAFCIENEWYLDGATDPSAEARAWLAEHGDAAKRARRMDEVTFDELHLRLGAQYLFVHHGSCEHAVVFTKCHLASSSDECSAVYPRTVWLRSFENASKACCICKKLATKEIHGDDCTDVLPCYLCGSCDYYMHYTADGELRRNDYRVYPLFSAGLDAHSTTFSR